jgi:SAM-dependent methyltransferase
MLIGLKRLLLPVGYWRYPAFAVTYAALAPRRPRRILDVGSPKLLALYLASTFPCRVYATDIQDPAIRTMWQRYFDALPRGMRQGYCGMEFQDGRCLAYADNSFDAAFSLSVLEHIPDDGDSRTMAEIGRVLRPGGRAVIEVPYNHKMRDTYLAADVYERRYAGAPVLYQRHYDQVTAQQRLIAPSGLELEQMIVVGERIPFERYWEALPDLAKAPGLGVACLASLFNHCVVMADEEADDRLSGRRRAMSLTLVLRKPAMEGEA